MTRVQTMVQLSDALVESLDREAARRKVSRSALIRDVLEEFLGADREALIDRRIVEGYRRIPPGVPDEWGDLAAMADQGTADLLDRLNAEERAAGHEPW
jgi:predicted transcriptional regulator